APKQQLPKITWTPALTWALINQAQAKENRNVMLGKEVGENSTRDNKTQVLKRIASIIIPEIFGLNKDAAQKRIGTKWDGLKTTYKDHASKLRQIGAGIEETQAHAESGVNAFKHKYMDCYVPPDGPDAETTPRAKNLWDEITTKWPYFSVLHSL
ncbi:hypothetical protein CPB83DRAFT_730007, partial [Crepidotus variabilis]